MATETPERLNISEYGAWFLGIIAAMLTFLAATFIIGNDLNQRNADGAKEKTAQVESCSNIKEPTASLVCVQELNK